MNYIVTFEQLKTVADTVLSNSSVNSDYNLLLDEEYYNNFNILVGKHQLQDLLSKFNSARYIYKFPIEENVKINNNYELREENFQKSIKSQVENSVEQYIDKQILITDIYKSIMKVSYLFTNEEAIYFANTFITHKSEDEISEIIGVSKSYLQKVKKSCIAKCLIELEQYF